MPPSLAEHTDIFWPLIGSLLALVGIMLTGYGMMAKYIATQAMKGITDTQAQITSSLTELWRQFSEVRDDFRVMQGEHLREMGDGGRRNYDPSHRPRSGK